MIVKKLKRTSFKKSKSVMIGGLVDYILAEHDDRGKDKLSYAGSRNFLTTTVAAQKREMISLAEESIQSKMPVTHWILSWQENEQPTSEQVMKRSVFFSGEWALPNTRQFTPCIRTRAIITSISP